MWAKKYLQEIQRLEENLNQRLDELSGLKAMYGLRGCGLSEKVQTSLRGDSLENAVIKCVELQKMVNNLTDEFVDRRNKAIAEIQSLNNKKYSELLYKRYIKYLSIKQIASDLQISENSVKGKLKRAEKKLSNTIYRSYT